MRKASVLYNPLSGRRRKHRLADVEAVLAVLRDAGVEAQAAATLSGPETSEQARQAVASGCDTIFACGGDGTVHDVLQGMVGTSAALAIIPLGTANALAHDQGIPLAPVRAAQAALNGRHRRIAVGRIEYRDFQGSRAQRYFTVAAGVGVDAHLFHALDPLHKHRLGMAAYYAKATHLWLTHRMERFAVDFNETGSREPRRVEVSELLAVRIRNFAGVLRELAPGASLGRSDLRLVLFRTTSRLRYLLYVQRGLFGGTWRVSGIELVYSDRVRCASLPNPDGQRIFVEADGELLGTLPAEIGVVPDALTLLVP
jgi:YegS/Rv2252/BmrU family lipid kinase